MRHTIKRGLLLMVFAFTPAAFSAAADFGLLLATEGEYISDEDGKGFGFTGGLTPWLSAAPGETFSLYLSGKLSFEYEYATKAWADPVLAELERAELAFRPGAEFSLTLGRQLYRDSAGMIASGLFDGLSGAFGFGWGRLVIGGFYTGFQYKERAEILMSQEDRDSYGLDLDYNDLDTYFASRRMLIPLCLEFPDLASRLSLALSGLAQIDLNKDPAPALHTQYLEAHIGIEALDSLRLNVTGIGERLAYEGLDPKRSYAAALGLDWDTPGEAADMLSLELRWGSGVSGENLGAFLPVNGIAQGTIFSETLSGLMNARAFYTARPREKLSFSLGTIFFWRTDLETFKDSQLKAGAKDRFLGTEVYGTLIWSPDSALRLTAGGGAFLPGPAFTEEANPRWEVRAGMVVAL
jgi:hypothetical protein